MAEVEVVCGSGRHAVGREGREGRGLQGTRCDAPPVTLVAAATFRLDIINLVGFDFVSWRYDLGGQSERGGGVCGSCLLLS